MKKYFGGIISAAAVLIIAAFLLGRFAFPNTGLKGLPKPEVSEGERGMLGIDKNINEANIDDYLGRSDAVYRDMRLLKDPGNYEAIGGDSYLSGFVAGFEVVPLPYLMNVTGLPEAVGSTYAGKTLFTEKNGNYTANYEESLSILESLFPKDKVIFLMCGGGGYAGMTKALLVANGWDADKIYDAGGYWFYEGENKIEIRRTKANGEIVYDFWKLAYHDIDFDTLTPKK
jgi:rhodanese-related sulfurtransferase